MVRYENDKKFAYFDGIKFTRDDETGYYLNSTIRKRLHRYVWKYHNGEIPEGYHIHHKDLDKSNNNINNLELVESNKHQIIHGRERFLRDKEWFKRFNKKGRKAAKKWHKSKEGRKWHKEHYEKVKNELRQEEEFECCVCGKNYKAVSNGNNKFCSNKCKSKWRRDQGLDDVKRECVICGKEFKVNKYTKTKTCSSSCASKLAYKNRSK